MVLCQVGVTAIADLLASCRFCIADSLTYYDLPNYLMMEVYSYLYQASYSMEAYIYCHRYSFA